MSRTRSLLDLPFVHKHTVRASTLSKLKKRCFLAQLSKITRKGDRTDVASDGLHALSGDLYRRLGCPSHVALSEWQTDDKLVFLAEYASATDRRFEKPDEQQIHDDIIDVLDNLGSEFADREVLRDEEEELFVNVLLKTVQEVWPSPRAVHVRPRTNAADKAKSWLQGSLGNGRRGSVSVRADAPT